MRFQIFAATAAAAMIATSAFAQAPAMPDMDEAVAAANNQLGVLEYCAAEGHIESTAVEVQERLLQVLPPASDPTAVEAAYAAGKEGTIAVSGTEMSLADAATGQGTDVAALCQQLGSMVEQAGASLPN
ncbi:pore-forming ESAT-6 family protein [Ketogulonicigenium vulgare]|nr:pore-forming ESAT-6 family protein [Ketogulonicigenium vulgare]